MKKQQKSAKSQPMTRYVKLVILLAVVVTAALATLGLSLYKGAVDNSSIALLNQKAVITVSGTVACLPHKDTSGPQTAECLYGVKVGSGYYAINDHTSLAATYGEGSQLTVTGTLVPPATDEKYAIVGTITTASIARE